VEEDSVEALKLGHRLVDAVTKDIETMQFNTAIARMMEFVNEFVKLKNYPKNVLRMAVQMLCSFAPHISEELWEHLGGKTTIAYEPLIKVEKKYLEDDMVTYVVQINGKLRASMHLPKDKSKEDIYELAIQQHNVKNYMTGKVEKVIFVPNKLLNIVIKAE
jgi:leucyl-tRNA synthetase